MLEPKILKEYFFGFLVDRPYLLFEFLAGFIPIIVCLCYSKTTWQNSKILYIYSAFIFLLEIIGGVFSANSKLNHFIYLWFYFIESILLVYYYKKEILSDFFHKLLVMSLILVLVAVSYNLFFGIGLMDNYSGSIQSLAFISISIMCFYYILSKLAIKNLLKSTLFWVNTGNLVYFSGRFFICLYILEIMNNKKYIDLEGYWYIVSGLLIFHRIFLAIGISNSKYSNT
ncbi:MAG: hypothetical protein V4683_00700 [Bacteroidota bacterium]